MKPSTSIRRMLPATLVTCTLVLSTAGPTPAATLHPDKLVILSTTDVRGDLNPCGCSTPKGGLARRASFADSMRASYGQVLLVDSGGFFHDKDSHRDVGAFLMGAMRVIGTDAVGLGERDLRFGAAFLAQNVERTKLPVVCANLLDAGTGKPLVAPHLVKKVGDVKVGIFGLIDDRADLGPARDSLEVVDPARAAAGAVAALRRQGATVVVLLSQLGKTRSEDLVADVDGIDAVVVGHDTPVIQKGRMIKNTIACYGGERGQYICRTAVTLDGQGRMTDGDAEAFVLGPSIPDKPEVLALVRSFEDAFNERLRKAGEEPSAGVEARPAETATDR